MRLLCPNCAQNIVLPDESAGQAVHCPLCQAEFTAPVRFAAAPPEPPPVPTPPPVVPESFAAPPVGVAAATTPATPTANPGGLRLVPSRAALEWAAPVMLAVAFVLTFFSWGGAYPAGYGIYTQNAWQAAGRSFRTDFAGNKHMGLVGTATKPVDWDLRQKCHNSPYLVAYLIVLILALALAWVSVLVPILGVKLPPQLEAAWPYRTAVLVALLVAALGLVIAQPAAGLGVENAVTEKVDAQFAEKLAKAQAGGSDEDRQLAEMERAEALAVYHLRQTWVLYAAVVAHTLALAALAFAAWLRSRGDRPDPYVEIAW